MVSSSFWSGGGGRFGWAGSGFETNKALVDPTVESKIISSDCSFSFLLLILAACDFTGFFVTFFTIFLTGFFLTIFFFFVVGMFIYFNIFYGFDEPAAGVAALAGAGEPKAGCPALRFAIIF